MKSALAFGSNYFGQLGIGFFDREWKHIPIACNDIKVEDTKQICCGAQVTVILKKNGTISIFGGLNGSLFPSLTQVSISYPLKCSQIACGKKHIVALMDGGYVLSWGFGLFGQLGHGDDCSWDQPRMINRLRPAELGAICSAVACGSYHSCAITSEGRAFMWGLNKSAQCGLGFKSDVVTEPRPVEFKSPVKVTTVSCGRSHSIALSKSGRLWAWGASSFGRLGIMDAPKFAVNPCEILSLQQHRCVEIACGDFHSLALTDDSSVYSWGQGGDGQLGHANLFNLRTPQPVEELAGIDIISLKCGPTWSFAISSSGLLYGWGNAEGGWICDSPKSVLTFLDGDGHNLPLLALDTEVRSFDSNFNILVPTAMKLLSAFYVKDIICGAGHTLAIVSDRASDDGTVASFDQAMNLFLWARQGDSMAIKQFLLSISNIDSIIDTRDADGNTPLIAATQYGQFSVVKLLIRFGANVNSYNNKRNTSLHYSFAFGHLEISEYLISVGGDEFLCNEEGLTCYEGLTREDLDLL